MFLEETAAVASGAEVHRLNLCYIGCKELLLKADVHHNGGGDGPQSLSLLLNLRVVDSVSDVVYIAFQ